MAPVEKIRRLRRRDIIPVCRLIEEVLKRVNIRDYNETVISNLVELYSPENFKRYLKSRKCFLLEVDGEPAGTICIRENKIYTLFVSVNYQGKGYGRRLMKFAENKISKKGYERSRLLASLTAFKFYERLGYIKIGYEQDKDYGDVVVMEKPLNLKIL